MKYLNNLHLSINIFEIINAYDGLEIVDLTDRKTLF